MVKTKDQKDAELWRALLELGNIEYVDNRDMEPIFEIQLPCDWRITDFEKAVKQLLKEIKRIK